MAHIGKFPATSLGRLFLHNNRKQGDGTIHQNEEIDDERTHLNYYFVKCDAKDVKKRLKDYYYSDRKDLVVLAEATVTLPKDVHKEDSRKFFESCYNFFCKDFGKENVVNAVVHMDETTPHLHLDFLPVVPIEREKLSTYFKKVIENREHNQKQEFKGKICAKELLTREYYQKFHIRLNSYVKADLGYEVEILNGATHNGNKTLLQLKNASLQAEIEAKKELLKNYTNNINNILEDIDRLHLNKEYFNCPELLMQMSHLEEENIFLRKSISEYNKYADKEHQFVLDKDEFSKLEEEHKKKEITFNPSHFYVVTNIPKDLTDYARVIETYKDIPRLMPDWRFIESNHELEEIINQEPKEVFLYTCINGEKFIIFPTDNISDTAQNLIELQENDKEYKKQGVNRIIFPQISNDTFNMAEAVLRNCEFDTVYKLRKKKDDKERYRDRSYPDKND